MPRPENQNPPTQVNASGCFVRLVWMLLSNIVLVVCALFISKHTTNFSLADVVFWCTVVVALWLRYIDITRLGGQTAYGQPATLAHWRRYAVLLTCLAFVLWFVAHVIALKAK
jgi:hypothetical protein